MSEVTTLQIDLGTVEYLVKVEPDYLSHTGETWDLSEYISKYREVMTEVANQFNQLSEHLNTNK